MSIVTKLTQSISSLSKNRTQLLVVTKTQSIETIEPLLAEGHRIFGENRVQEALSKWPSLKHRYPDIELHLIGPLQTNKLKQAVALFDVIETVDRAELAEKLAKELKHTDKKLRCYIQINTGEEPQKAGIHPSEASAFITYCQEELSLPIEGLMCIPPVSEDPALHFALLKKLALQHHLPQLSMGMSNDYMTAIQFGATYVRIGSAIFGERMRG